MNQRQYSASEKLTATQLAEDRGAFFKSVIGTLNHILIGDIVWLKRFALHPSGSSPLAHVSELDNPTSLSAILFEDLGLLKTEREKIDEIIINWIKQLSDNDLNDCLSYTNMSGKRFTRPLGSLIDHLFLHQVHHRGQVTTLLSQFGVDFGETDLVEIIDECDDIDRT